MKVANVLLGFLLAVGVVALAGRKKKGPSSEAPPPMMIEGVKVELPKLVNSDLTKTLILTGEDAQVDFRI